MNRARAVVKKAVTFARKLGMPIIGIVENMSRFVCPHCGAKVDIFQSGGGKKISEELDVPFLGGIPIDQKICEDADKGQPFIVEHADSQASKAFMGIVRKIERFLEHKERLKSSSKLNLPEQGTSE